MPDLEALLKLVPPEHREEAQQRALNIRDTHARAVMDAIGSSEKLLRSIVEGIGDVFWSTNIEKSVMEYISPGYERIWGRSMEELLKNPRTWLEAIHPEDRERIQEALPKQPTGTYNEVYRVIRPDGELRWIRDRAFPIANIDGSVERVVGVAADITEIKELEAQLRQSQKMEAIGLLAGGVAHEFNNLLTPIIAYSELLTAENLSEEQQRFIKEIHAAGTRAQAITRALHTFNRENAFHQEKVFDFDTAVHDLEGILRPSLGENYHLEQNYRSNDTVSMEPSSLSQVVMNLVVNARDAMQSGGTITIETNSTTITKQHPSNLMPGRYVVLSVRDTGSGIPPDVLPKIFLPFFSTKSDKGSGLGLATTYNIVKSLGGHIDVNSTVGRGTVFTVYFPAYNGPIEEVTSAKPLPVSTVSKNILVIDDEPSIQKVTYRILKQQGHHVETAGDLHEALTRAGRERLDLVISDIILPGTPGPEVVERIKKMYPDLAVIFMTGYAHREVAEQTGVDLGRETVLEKPFAIKDFIEAVNRKIIPAYKK